MPRYMHLLMPMNLQILRGNHGNHIIYMYVLYTEVDVQPFRDDL